MNPVLPRLRMDLEFMPSPVADRPGLLIRDRYLFSDVTMIIPPQLVSCLIYFDGEKTENDLRAALFEMTGDLRIGELEQHLIESLKSSGFLEEETFFAMREARLKEFADSPVLLPSHAGSAYPDDKETLDQMMRHFLNGAAEQNEQPLVGIAAPHASFEPASLAYRAAYAGLPRDRYADRTFVVLGTSHYGPSERFGLTRKAFVTPWGETRPATGLIDELASAAPDAVTMEDFNLSIEHSIEFQVIFLQYLFGPDIRILPILCGSYAKSIYGGGLPEDDENVSRFLDSLSEVAAREGDKLFWVLGVDMAHVGRRYEDDFSVQAGDDRMSAFSIRDHARIERISAGDRTAYWEMVKENHDDLKWCGSSPFYTFMKVQPQVRGQLSKYDVWNIDSDSVVSFAGMQFTR